MIRHWLFALLILAAPVAAKDISLGLPIDCTLGETCFIQQYVDRDAGPAHRDFTCGNLSYNGHKGTDFALPSLAAMNAGVDVLVATDGIIAATRNDIADVIHDTKNAPNIDGKECGNGILVKHTGGWETQYCHLKQGSVIVARGQKVTRGDVLGQVGLSGKTQFPHLHLSVRKHGAVIDPFDADETLTCDGSDGHDLWQTEMPYVGAGVISLGFAPNVPKYAAIKAGTAHNVTLPNDTPALVLWGYAYGGQRGDILELSISGPNNEVISHQARLKKAQSQFFRAVGKRNKTAAWPTGNYKGVVRLIRGDQILDQATIILQLK